MEEPTMTNRIDRYRRTRVGLFGSQRSDQDNQSGVEDEDNREAQDAHSSSDNSQAGDHHIGHDGTAVHHDAEVVDGSAGGAVRLRGVLGCVRRCGA